MDMGSTGQFPRTNGALSPQQVAGSICNASRHLMARTGSKRVCPASISAFAFAAADCGLKPAYQAHRATQEAANAGAIPWQLR